MGLNIAKFENSLMKTGFMTKLTSPKAATTAATIALVSNLTKDAFNCYYYVTQSLRNERIPEDKRKFVAGLDLSNGILNVITQTLIGANVMRWSDKLFDKFIEPKYYGEKAIESLSKKIKNNSLEELKDVVKLNKSCAKIGLSVISTLVATQVVCKRIIVPLIATPMATFFKKQFEKHDPKYQNKVAGDKVSFENNHSSDATNDVNNAPTKATSVAQLENNNKLNKNLPHCFQSFVE